jgi:autotransporter-associated beta strand protein
MGGIVSNGGLTKGNAGTLTLTAANTYSGGTLISGGRLAGSTLSLQGVITNNSDLLFNQTTNGTYSSVLSGTGTVVKDGTGTVTFSGANSYSGATTISNGTLALGNATALGTTAAGTTIANGASLDLNGQTVGAEAITLRGLGVSAAGGIINSSATDASLSGAITLDLATNSIGTSAGNITLSGVIGETGGARPLVKVGTGTVILSGANTYTGVTTNSAGTLIVANNTALGTTPAPLLSPTAPRWPLATASTLPKRSPSTALALAATVPCATSPEPIPIAARLRSTPLAPTRSKLIRAVH